MEKKRSVGVTLLAICFILVGVISIPGAYLSYWIMGLEDVETGYVTFRMTLAFLNIILSFCCGIGILILREWARKLTLFYVFFGFISYLTSMPAQIKILKSFGAHSIMYLLPFLILVLAIYVAILFFFTRPKVKDQFK